MLKGEKWKIQVLKVIFPAGVVVCPIGLRFYGLWKHILR
jgi:hypothetical protein